MHLAIVTREVGAEHRLVGAIVTVHVPYTDADLKAVQTSFACCESQFPAETLEYGPLQAHQAAWQGEVFLRAWFRAVSGDDVFALRSGEGQ